MGDSIMNTITLDLLVKTNHFYHQRTVQVRNGVFKYFKQDSPTNYLFQANLSDIILIDRNTKEDKPEILLSSKSNSFSLFKISHEQNHILFSFKTQLERMIEIENNKIKEEEERMKLIKKHRPLDEMIRKYSLVSLYSLPIEVKDIIDSKYKQYKCNSNIEIASTNISKLLHLDQTLFLYDNILFIQAYGKNMFLSKINNQLFLSKFISFIIFVLSIVYFTTYCSLYQMLMILLVMCPFINKIVLFIKKGNSYNNNEQIQSSDTLILKSCTFLHMNMLHILEYIIIECQEITIKNTTKLFSNETFFIYPDLNNNMIILIESSKDLSQILFIYVLQSNGRLNITQIVLYSVLVDNYLIDYQKDAFLKLNKLTNKIQLRLEEVCFNQNESFLINDDVNININDSVTYTNEMKIEIVDSIDKGETGLFGQAKLLNYKDIIQLNDDNILKQEVQINLNKDSVIRFALNCNNLILVNEYLKHVVMIPKEGMIQFTFEFQSTGAITFKAYSEYEDVEIKGIEYTVIAYKNSNIDAMKGIDHFGLYIWNHDNQTYLCSWIKYISDFMKNEREALLSELQLYLNSYKQLEEIISNYT